MKNHRYHRPASASAVCTLALTLGGCAAGHIFVLDRPEGMPAYSTVYLYEGGSTAALEPAQKEHFESMLRTRLRREPALGLSESPRDDALSIEYRIVALDKGSAAARVVNGAIQVVGVPVSGLGDGTLGVDVIYRDRSGAAIAHIVADGPIAGLLGSTNAGLDSAAESISAFTKKTFRAPDSAAVALH